WVVPDGVEEPRRTDDLLFAVDRARDPETARVRGLLERFVPHPPRWVGGAEQALEQLGPLAPVRRVIAGEPAPREEIARDIERPAGRLVPAHRGHTGSRGERVQP